jgi:predicted Holliday junction resolvase-like endonuclease
VALCLVFFYSKNKDFTREKEGLEDLLIQKQGELDNLRQTMLGTVSAQISSEVGRISLELERQHENKYQALLQSLPAQIEKAKNESLKTQRAVIKGQLSEQWAPFHPDFQYESSDCLFLGKPFDLLILSGLSQDNIQEIVFMDIKTGGAQLNKHQRQIRDCIKDGKISFRKLSLLDDGSIK